MDGAIAPVTVQDVPRAAARGRIVLARHGKSALSRRCWLNAAQYRDWWSRYDQLGIDPASHPPESFLQAAHEADVVFSSTLLRSRQTAALAANGRSVVMDAIFVEAPLPPPTWPAWLKLKPRFWGVIARFYWLQGGGKGETVSEARKRASDAADRLMAEVAAGRVVFLAAHGWFNRMIGQELVQRGWVCVDDGGYRHWAVRVFEPRG
jgi:broad specificity phosphatase PhoE